MITSSGEYLGRLRTESRHERSGNKVVTDAPVDNHGLGEAFSPTDLVCSALASCMVTIMGIVGEREGIALNNLRWELKKEMASDPRRIDTIRITFWLADGDTLSAAQKQKLKHAARTCPVALSLHPDIKQEVTFNF